MSHNYFVPFSLSLVNVLPIRSVVQMVVLKHGCGVLLLSELRIIQIRPSHGYMRTSAIRPWLLLASASWLERDRQKRC